MRSQLGGKLSRCSDVSTLGSACFTSAVRNDEKAPRTEKGADVICHATKGGRATHAVAFAICRRRSSFFRRRQRRLLLQELFCCCSPCENSSRRRRQNVESSHSDAPSHRHKRDPGAGACRRSLGAFPQALHLSEVASRLPATPPEFRRRRNFTSRQSAGKHQKLELG